jgi:mono/diheme cytochrome c family protein
MGMLSGIRRIDLIVWSLAALFLTHAAMAAVPPTQAATSAVYTDECGACHTAYPARLLRPADWAAVLATLDRHFGVDASLDVTARAAVAKQLGVDSSVASTSTPKAVPRITQQGWFRKEHDEISAQLFRSPAVRSAANCGACHAGADRGQFDEDSVRIPR